MIIILSNLRITGKDRPRGLSAVDMAVQTIFVKSTYYSNIHQDNFNLPGYGVSVKPLPHLHVRTCCFPATVRQVNPNIHAGVADKTTLTETGNRISFSPFRIIHSSGSQEIWPSFTHPSFFCQEVYSLELKQWSSEYTCNVLTSISSTEPTDILQTMPQEALATLILAEVSAQITPWLPQQ